MYEDDTVPSKYAWTEDLAACACTSTLEEVTQFAVNTPPRLIFCLVQLILLYSSSLS